MTHYQALVEIEEVSISHWINQLQEVDYNWLSSIGLWVNLCDSIRRRTERAREEDKVNA